MTAPPRRVPPSTRAADVVVLVRDRGVRARIVESVRGHAGVVCCDRVGDVWPALQASGTHGRRVSACLLEPRDADAVGTDGLVAALRERFPIMPVLAYCSPSRTTSPDLLAMVRAGASGLILQGYDDAGLALRSAIDAATADCAARHISAAIESDLPRRARDIVQFCITHGREPISVGGVARALGIDRKTLAARLAHAGLPEPRVVVAWSRLCLVVHALDAAEVSIERTAMDFGFPSAPALHNLCKRYTGCRLTELRAQGGLPRVLAMFRQALSP